MTDVKTYTVRGPKGGARLAGGGMIRLIEEGQDVVIDDGWFKIAIAEGCLVIHVAGEVDDETDILLDADQRAAAIQNAVASVVAARDATQLTAAGFPKAAFVSAAAGFEVSRAEVNAAYDALVQEHADS